MIESRPTTTDPLIESQNATPNPDQPEPHYTDFQLFVQKTLELRDTDSDRATAKTMDELAQRISDNPLSAIKEIDSAIRGRDNGTMKDWTARTVTNLAIGAGATALDYLDSGKDAAELSAPMAAIIAGIEYLTDTAITLGTNYGVSKASGLKDARYASPLSEIIGSSVNLLPFGKSLLNSVNIEAAFRLSSGIPVFGGIVERLHTTGDHLIDKGMDNPKSKWAYALLTIMSRAYVSKGKTANIPMGPIRRFFQPKQNAS